MDAPRYVPSPVSTTAPKHLHLPHLVPPLGPHEPANQLPWQSPPVSTQPSSYWTSSSSSSTTNPWLHIFMVRQVFLQTQDTISQKIKKRFAGKFGECIPPCGFCKENEPRNRPMFMSHPVRIVGKANLFLAENCVF